MGFSLGCFGCIPGPQPTTDDRVTPEKVEVVKRFSWGEIERLTMKFKEVIGVGGYSTVYLANFQDSSFGAVKIYNGSERLHQVFKNELEISLRLHHANIVKLLGYCDERDEGVLVFEYIPKGNLQEKLHNHNKNQITWKQRISIAYQIAQTLDHLHESGDIHIVHGDIKSSNVLLDEQLSIKICDFGFSRMGFASTIKPPSSSRISMMGSPGYIDPHFLMTGIASKKSDIYSFGVIILELITGFEAFICSEEDKQMLLTSLVRSKESFDVQKVVKMVDPRVVNSEGFDSEQVEVLGTIAGECLHHLPSLRPSASDICKMMREKLCLIEKV